MVDDTIWKLDITPGNSQATLKAFENSLNAVKAQIGQVAAAGENFSKLESFQINAAKAGKQLELAQASAALALKKAQDAASSGKVSAEQLAVMQARAGVTAENVTSKENALGAAMAKVQAESDRLAKAMQQDSEKTSFFARTIEAAQASLGKISSGFGSALQGVGDLGEGALHTGGSILSGFKNAAGGILEFGSKLGMTVFGVQQLAQTVIGLGSALIGNNASMEQTDVAFTQLLGSSSAAQAELKDLQKFAADTPFEFPDVADATQKFLAFQIPLKDTKPLLTAIGDALSGLGKNTPASLQQVVDVFGQMNAAGKIQTQDLMQLTSVGINGFQILADQMHKPVSVIKDMVTSGVIPAKDGIEMLRAGMEKTFGGGMQAQSRTFNGLLSTLQDNAQGALRAFSGPIFDMAKGGLQKLGDLVSSPAFQQFAKDMGEKVGGALQHLGEIAAKTWKILDDEGIGILIASLQNLATTIGNDLSPVLAPLADAFKNMFSDKSMISGANQLEGSFYDIALAVDNMRGGLNFLGNVFKQVMAAMHSQTVKDILKAFQDFGSYVASVFAPVWQELVLVWQTELAPAFKQLQDALQPLQPVFQAIGGALLALAVILGAIFVGLLTGIARGLSIFLQGFIMVFSGIVQIITGFVGVIAGIVAFIYDLFTGNFGKLGADLLTIWNGIMSIGHGFGEAMIGLFVAVFGTIGGFVWGFVEGVIGFFVHLYNMLVGHSIIPDMINGIISWFAQLPGRALGAIQSLAGSIGGFFSGIATDAWNAGSSIVKNIADGITNAIHFVTDAISNVTSWISAHLPHSPAKVGPLRDLHLQGAMITEQISQGMLASMPKLNAAIGAITTPISTNLSVAGAQSSSSSADPNTAILLQILAELQKHGKSGGNLTLNNTMQGSDINTNKLARAIGDVLGQTYEGVQRGAW